VQIIGNKRYVDIYFASIESQMYPFGQENVPLGVHVPQAGNFWFKSFI